MEAVLTIFAVVSMSILVVRIGAVAFQQTGLSEVSSRFWQCLSLYNDTSNIKSTCFLLSFKAR